MSSLSSLEGQNPSEKVKTDKEISSYPSNSNYPRKLSNKIKDKKTSAATKSVEDQKLTIRKDFIAERQQLGSKQQAMVETKRLETAVESRQKAIQNEKLVLLDDTPANSNSEIQKESDENQVHSLQPRESE